MSTTKNMHTTKDSVLTAIQSGKVTMRPKWYFFLQTVLMSLGLVLVVIIAVYSISLTVFALQRGGPWFGPSFGLNGWMVLFESLPWELFVIGGLFLFILEMLVRRYEFAYRQPILFVLGGVLIIVVCGGYMLSLTPLHGWLFKRAQQNTLPLAGPLYNRYGNLPFQHVYRGMVTRKENGGFSMLSIHGENLFVVVNKDTHFLGVVDADPGDTMFVFGDKEGTVIHAFGIEEVGDGM